MRMQDTPETRQDERTNKRYKEASQVEIQIYNVEGAVSQLG